MGFATTFFYSQFFGTPSYPAQDFTGKTIIVTGSNTGLGFEAARHFARLNCKKLILAVRTISKGEQAKESIQASTQRKSDCIEVWPLDLSSTASVKAFAAKAQSLERVDVLVENAGIMGLKWEVSPEGNEAILQTNAISTFLLALLMLPKLKETAEKFKTVPHLAMVTSELYQMAKFPERDSDDIYASLNDPKTSNIDTHYSTTKLLEILFIRELAKHVSPPSGPIVTTVNPGFCYSDFVRGLPAYFRVVFVVWRYLVARTTEVGSRCLVAGASAGKESHGQYMADGENQELMGWVATDEGARVQKKVWEQTLDLLEKIEPGIRRNV